MAVQNYNMPVILPDLRREESYHQIVDALEYLDAVANDVFNRISCRVAHCRDELTGINNRILTAQAKIDKLHSSSTKATRVFSSPKYPAPENITDYHTIYEDFNPALHKVRKNKTPIESRLPEVTAEGIRAKSRPFIFPLRQRRRRRGQSNDDPEMGEGLGRLPRHLPSVSSLLLFNTTENPYKKYVVLDPLEGAKTKTRDKIGEEENKLSEAPVTITKGEELQRGQQDSIMYVPLMPELPELDVPEMLQLPYVASDMFFQGDSMASIAPSLANTTVPDLPNLADPDAPAATAAASGQPPPSPSDTGAGGGGGAPPPPPPPPPPVNAPPLPPIGGGDSDDEEGGGQPGDAPEGVPDEVGGDGRATLMEAIRQAGGASKAKLKSSKNRKQQRKAKKEGDAEISSGGGDLLGDLSAALGRRRKAMSGKDKDRDSKREDKKEDHSLGGGSMMDNISRMIPAPPKAVPGGDDSEEESGGADW